jgi:hypothetical protein
VKGGSQGIKVCTSVDRSIVELLWSSKSNGSEQIPGGRQALEFGTIPGDSEISNLDSARPAEENVRRFDIPMNDSSGMERFESGSDGEGYFNGSTEREPAMAL